MIIPVKKSFALLIVFFLAGNMFGQQALSPVAFDAIYDKGLASVNFDLGYAEHCLDTLSLSHLNFSPIQKAKINFLRFKVNYSDKNRLKDLEKRLFSVPDSLRNTDSLLYLARKYLERSMPDKSIPLLLKALGNLPGSSNQADLGTIYLSEAYRQKQEYVKGIAMLHSLLNERSDISDKNRAYAYNRLAALFNEWGSPGINVLDSVFRYSELCIVLSEKTGNKSDLAASQNEQDAKYTDQCD